MSLLDILKPRPEQLRAAARQSGKSRTTLRLAHEDNKAERDKERMRLRKKRFRARHPGTDSNLERLRAWTQNNWERFRRAQRRWARENRDRVNKAARDYRARQKAAS
jgi:hypothetical protein